MSRPLLALILCTTACVQVTRIDDTEADCIPTAVQAAFDRSCARGGCHDAAGAAAGLVLDAPASADVLGRTASQKPLPLVTLGDPSASYLAQKLMPDPTTPIVGASMPIGFDASNAETVEDVAIILGWIAGAVLPGCDVGETSGGETTGGPPVAGDLPCEIEQLLAQRCRSCHGDPLRGAPMPLITHDDLLAPAPSDPSATTAEKAAARMADPTAPMPPGASATVPAVEVAAFEAWLAAGAPAGTCETEPDPFDVEPRCTSNVFWDRDDDGDPRMHPGRDCVTCHDAERREDPDDDDIPDLVVGGTVYPTGHEPNDCFGDAAADLRVVIRSLATDAEVSLAPNASGNFLLHRGTAPPGFEPPFSVKLVAGDRERVMAMPAPQGSCNACHTQDGAMNAPGRIVSP
jgi:hypothetical protein